MLLLEAVVIIIVVLVAAFLKARQEANKPSPNLPYVTQARLLTPTEERFRHVLAHANQDQYLLVCKPRVADILRTQPFSQTAFNKISSKHFDFVLCDKTTTRPLFVIELDDRSHSQASAQARDAVKDAACRAAGLPFLRVPVQSDYDKAYLQKRIVETIDKTSANNA